MSQAYSIIYDRASYDLAKGVAKDLGAGEGEMVEIIRTAFKDGEFKLRFSKEVKADEAVLVMRLYPNANDNVVALMFALSKLKGMGKSIRVVLPYLAYARQDKEFLSGEVASIYVIGDMMAHYGVKELITIDVHSQRIIGSFGVKVTNLSASSMLAEYLRSSGRLSNPLVISPDEGSIERARIFAEYIEADYTHLEKHRDRTTGEITTDEKELGVKGREAIIFDDMIVSGGTIANAAKMAKSNGATKVLAVCTHALLIDGAPDKLKDAGVDSIIASNTISNNFAGIDVSALISKALQRDA